MVASLEPHTASIRPRAIKSSRKGLLAVAAAFLAVAVAVPTLISSSEVHGGYRLAVDSIVPPASKPDNNDVCSLEKLRTYLAKVDPLILEKSEVLRAVSLSELEDLGGERVYVAKCTDGGDEADFQVVWTKSSSGWSLKKISRQP